MKLKLLLFISITIICVSCDPKDDPCASVFPPIPATVFMVVESTTGEPLIGSSKTYKPDTVNLLNMFSPFRINEDSDSLVEFFFGGVGSGDEILFQLSRTVIDTIMIEYNVRETECFNIKDLQRFYYNHELIESDHGLYVVKK
jgi:hypothetical protein